ncbi:MAG: hypothetical protein M3394_08040 [Actinomycetota bacterium]|nr:hypothetical protein [Actinomycetota bacterium]
MAVTEHGRFVLYRHFEAEMGEDKARTLMDHLLPVGWTDLATKQDLREVAHELALVRESMATKADIADLRSEMYKGFTSVTLSLVAAMVGLQGLLLAGLKLL